MMNASDIFKTAQEDEKARASKRLERLQAGVTDVKDMMHDLREQGVPLSWSETHEHDIASDRILSATLDGKRGNRFRIYVRCKEDDPEAVLYSILTDTTMYHMDDCGVYAAGLIEGRHRDDFQGFEEDYNISTPEGRDRFNAHFAAFVLAGLKQRFFTLAKNPETISESYILDHTSRALKQHGFSHRELRMSEILGRGKPGTDPAVP